ncbi:MAG: hypothetical protein AAB071_04200 [Bacteroidota bacterium]
MINLKTFFKIHLDAKNISDDNMEKFTDDHIHRLTNNNTGGKYTARITATQNAYNTYFGTITKEDRELSTQRAKTKTVDTLIAEFKDAVRTKEGTIRGVFHAGSPEYIKFFPHGITEYDVAIKANIKTLMDRMAHFAAEYEAQLGGELLQIFETLYNEYKAARGVQLDAIDVVDADRQATSVKRDVVEIQVMRNVLALADEYLGEPEMVEVFFDQTIIQPDKSGTATFWEGNVNASATVTIVERSFATGTQMLLRNTGSAQLSFCLAAAEGIACGNNNIVVDGMSEKQIGIEDMGNIVNTFLNVTNMDASNEGRWEVEIV